jgi:2-polyprenyl-6-methoxyphenol hydroxylase-like FAD-dependent oxidoreductase
MRIAIIGGGIGGLTAALALRQFGFEPEIFEQAPELLEVGAAILMWPNAMRVLHRLGLSESVRQRGALLKQTLWLRHDGREIKRFPLPKTDEPPVALHRAELQELLVQALPRESIHLGHVFDKFEQRQSDVLAHFTNGAANECDVLIGADGLHSRVRTQLLGDGPPADRGYVAWRGVAPEAPKSLPPASAIEIHGKGQRFGIGPLGFGKVGWWCSVNQSHEIHEINREAASPEEHATVREQLAQLFDGWCEPVNELIQTTPLAALVRNPVFDRPPVRKWGGGSVTLLGDAIHPTTPNLGQGGCLAIEDAVVVARCLSQYASDPQTGKRVDAIQSALRRFESLRFSRTAMVARLSRLYGAVGQWENPTATELRSWVLSTIPAALVQRVLRWTFDYDAYDVTI